MQSLAPIALFVYNRPLHTARTVKFLQQNLLAQESRLFIFSDAAKTQKDEDKVQEVRAFIKGVNGFKSVEIVERPQNLGLASSIIDGVTRLTDEYGKVIVFEDDLLSSPYTLQYFNTALSLYEQNEKVMHIGAYMYPLNNRELPDVFFSRIVSSWGWATWKSSWQHFNPDIDSLIARFTPEKIHDFSIEKTMNFWKQVNEFKRGKNNSWAIRWYASVFLRGGLSVNPSRSLINNIGHDGTGVHSGLNDIYTVTVSNSPVENFPMEVVEHKETYIAIREFLRHRKGSLWERGIRFLNQKLASLNAK